MLHCIHVICILFFLPRIKSGECYDLSMFCPSVAVVHLFSFPFLMNLKKLKLPLPSLVDIEIFSTSVKVIKKVAAAFWLCAWTTYLSLGLCFFSDFSFTNWWNSWETCVPKLSNLPPTNPRLLEFDLFSVIRAQKWCSYVSSAESCNGDLTATFLERKSKGFPQFSCSKKCCLFRRFSDLVIFLTFIAYCGV